MSGDRNCPRDCERCPWRSQAKGYHVYVVASASAGLVKIGQSCRPKRRLQDHRLRYGDARLLGAWHVGCQGAANDAEGRALGLMPEATRAHGDWFAVDPTWASEAVASALAAPVREARHGF